MEKTRSQRREIYLGLGTNLGDRATNLAQARQLIEERVGAVTAASQLYETAAWGKLDQPDFFNQVLRVDTELSAERVLQLILEIELDMGRERFEKWGTRLIDIDLLFYGDEHIETPDLQVPHPHIASRNFVLIPLLELAPEMLHPTLKLSIEDLYWASPDTGEVLLVE